jgi:methionine synthase II (cobalamin-independent)
MTIEQIIENFDDAQTPDAKQNIIDSIDESLITEHAEVIKELKNQVGDLKDQLAEEEDAKINSDIEEGLMSLYTCTKSVNGFVEGNSYYVKVDDTKAKYIESFGEVPEALVDYINNIKPIVWVVTDNGIGSLKYKVLVDFEFSEYFTK